MRLRVNRDWCSFSIDDWDSRNGLIDIWVLPRGSGTTSRASSFFLLLFLPCLLLQLNLLDNPLSLLPLHLPVEDRNHLNQKLGLDIFLDVFKLVNQRGTVKHLLDSHRKLRCILRIEVTLDQLLVDDEDGFVTVEQTLDRRLDFVG